MNDLMTMMFEAEDLEQASPATVSRVGMIFCEIRNLDWQPLRDIWIGGLPSPFAEHSPLLVELFEWLLPAALYFVDKRCTVPTAVTTQVRAHEVCEASKHVLLTWPIPQNEVIEIGCPWGRDGILCPRVVGGTSHCWKSVPLHCIVRQLASVVE